MEKAKRQESSTSHRECAGSSSVGAWCVTYSPPIYLQVGYDAEFEPVMSCVIDMAAQYCDVEGIKEADPWCRTLEVSSTSSR